MHRRAALPILVAGILAAPDALSSAGLSVVVAQSQGPDETHGIAAHAQRTIALTSSQKRAIYVAVSHQRLHASVANIPLVWRAGAVSDTAIGATGRSCGRGRGGAVPQIRHGGRQCGAGGFDQYARDRYYPRRRGPINYAT